MTDQAELDRAQASEAMIQTVNPATGQPGKSYHPHQIEGGLAAARAARVAFLDWRRTSFAERAKLLSQWQAAPFARLCHPREEHLLPLMVAAGASDEPGRHDYGEEVLSGAVSGFRFA